VANCAYTICVRTYVRPDVLILLHYLRSSLPEGVIFWHLIIAMSLLTLATEANSYSNTGNKTDKVQEIKVSNQGRLETLVYICTYCTINHTSHTHTLKLNLLT